MKSFAQILYETWAGTPNQPFNTLGPETAVWWEGYSQALKASGVKPPQPTQKELDDHLVLQVKAYIQQGLTPGDQIAQSDLLLVQLFGLVSRLYV